MAKKNESWNQNNQGGKDIVINDSKNKNIIINNPKEVNQIKNTI